MYTVYSFAQTEQDLTIIVLLNKYYKDCGEGDLQGILTDQNPFEKIKERFGEDNILMMVSINDRDLNDGQRHRFRKIENIIFLKGKLGIETLDNKKITLIRVNHKLRPLTNNEDSSRTFASTTPSNNQEDNEKIQYLSLTDGEFHELEEEMPIPSKSFSKSSENSTPNTQRIEVIQVSFYENNSLGRFFEIEILDIALSLKQKGLLKYFMKVLPKKMELMISNSDITGHFFVKCTFNTEQNPQNPNCYQYNSQYSASNYKNLKHTNVPGQFITTPIQGDTSCGYFSQFFIVNAVEYVNLKSKDSKLEDLKPEDLVEHFKSSQFNLKIVQDVLNYFNPGQTVFRIKTELVESDFDRESYLIFSGEGEQNQTQYYCCAKKESDLGYLKTFGGDVHLYSIIEYENILTHYCQPTFKFALEDEEESSIKSAVQAFKNTKRPKSPKGRLNTRTSQQEIQSSITSSISNTKQQSLSSQNQIELARDKAECKESNFVQPEQSNTTANKSEPYTPQSQTQSVQNTDSSFNKKQISTLQKSEFLSPTMKLSLRKLGSLKNETKQSRLCRPSDQLRSIKIKTENQIQSFGHHRFNHSQIPCRLVSEVPYSLSKTEDALKTTNSRAKSVINHFPFVHHPIKSFQQNQQLKQVIEQQKPGPIENKEGIVSYARISPINVSRIHQPQAQLNQTNDIHPLQPLEPIVKPMRISKIAISQAKAQIASLERDQQHTQRSSSTFNPHQQ